MNISMVVHPSPHYLNDNIFSNDCRLGARCDTLRFGVLRDQLIKLGHRIHTQDIITPETAELVIVVDNATFRLSESAGLKHPKMFLIVIEPYMQKNWDIRNHAYFDKVFTYNSLLLNDQYKLMLIAADEDYYLGEAMLQLPSEEQWKQRKFTILVSGAFCTTPEYPSNNIKRLEVLEFFSKTNPSGLELFGRHWDGFLGPRFMSNFPTIVRKFLVRFQKFYGWARLGGLTNRRVLKVFRGPLPAMAKVATLAGYKFNFALENENRIPGLVTEKIFDCFAAGTVPIYDGPPDIQNLIPRESYIDFKQFENLERLQDYLESLSYEDWIKIAAAGRKFLLNIKSGPFGTSNSLNNLMVEIEKLS